MREQIEKELPDAVLLDIRLRCTRATASGSRSTVRSTSASAGFAARSNPIRPASPRCIRTVRNAGYMFIPNGN